MFLKSISVLFLAILVYILIQVFYPTTETEKPLLVWWTHFMPNTVRETDCFKAPQCQIVGDQGYRDLKNLGAYLFYGSHLENYDFPLPRNNTILWAIYHEESPKNYAPFLYEQTQNLFNISATFSTHSDFPLTLLYLERIDLLTDKSYFRSVREKNSYLNQLAPVIYLQSDCDTPSDRDMLVKGLMQYVKIDSYGKCLKNKEVPEEVLKIDSLDYYNEALMDLVSKYKFVISFENAICQHYVTEKLWRPLFVGAVPIYLGSPSIEDLLPNKHSAILVENFKNNTKQLADYILKINKNDTLYNSFLDHKIYGRIENKNLLKTSQLFSNFKTGHSVTDFECFVCQKVYDFNAGITHYKKEKSIYDCQKPSNSWSQHWDIGRCQSKALSTLMHRNKPFSKLEFEQLWRLECSNKE